MNHLTKLRETLHWKPKNKQTTWKNFPVKLVGYIQIKNSLLEYKNEIIEERLTSKILIRKAQKTKTAAVTELSQKG